VFGEDDTVFTRTEDGILETSPEAQPSNRLEIKPWWKRLFV